MAKFEIQLKRTIIDYAVVEIEAPSQRSAVRKAYRLVEKEPSRFCDGDAVRVRISEIIEKPEGRRLVEFERAGKEFT